MPKQDVVLFAAGVTNQSDIEYMLMKNAKIKYKSFETINSTPFDAEVLSFWYETARIQLTSMNAISAYLD
ncbi:hypothetical protein [Halomonas salinarum]|uniref:hypothetical protein n=1 Tax=Halomonas salinarum TaxID=1158993 RepID=UPI00143A7F25|nr:hypothetical protein [Halomonas salinarum]